MLMYNKDNPSGVEVHKDQVATMEKAGFSKKPVPKSKPKPKPAPKVEAKIDDKPAPKAGNAFAGR